jgi:hypothetical protein
VRRVRAAAGALAAAVAAAALGLAAPAQADTERYLQFSDDRIVESSGLAASRVHDGVIYTHNDSDAGPVVYAVGEDGDTRAALTLRDAPARDWEALAPGPGPDGGSYLYVGDIGDNILGWDDIRVMRFEEPEELEDGDVEFTLFRFAYADGKKRDAEALLVHPRTGRLYVVSKGNQGGGVYRAPEKLKTGSVNLLRRIADAPATVTDGTFTTDGEHAVLRGYRYAFIVDSEWKKVDELDSSWGFQGESIAATPDGDAMLFGSEGLGSSVYRTDLPAEIGEGASPSPSPSKKGKKKSSASPDPDGEDDGEATGDEHHEGLPFVDGRTVAGIGALSLAGLVLVLFVRRG